MRTVADMSTLAVLAHYDPDGLVANHVVGAVDQLRPIAEKVVFVTTATLTPGAKARLDQVDEVIERPNSGYDFYSWRTGLLAAGDPRQYDCIILANDSVVGPLVPVSDLLHDMNRTASDAYGISTSTQGGLHVQSYWTALGPQAIQHPAVTGFWQSMSAVDDRAAVIERYELGLGRSLAAANLRLGSYFQPTPHEGRLMAARMASFHRSPPSRQAAAAAAYALQPLRRVDESPVLALWDRVFEQARLPVVKVSLFTRNPYRIDRGAVLGRLSQLYPEAFDGFADYLRRIGVSW